MDALQGQEADICIVSAVRAPPPASANCSQEGLGFLDDNRRTNVMLSRAQQLLVIVGDAQAWLRGPPGSLLRAFAAKSLAEGCCFGVEGDFLKSDLISSPTIGHISGLLVHLQAANEPAHLESIWKAPISNFVQTIARVENLSRQKRVQIVPSKSKPGIVGGGNFGKRIELDAINEKQERSGNHRTPRNVKVTGSAVSGQLRSSLSATELVVAGPTSETIVAVLKRLAGASRHKEFMGVIFMRKFPKGSWRSTSHACRCYEAAGLSIRWQGSNFFVRLP